MPTLDELAPRTVREKKLDLQLEPGAEAPQAFVPIVVLVSYDRALPAGIMLPLIFEVQAPSSSSYRRREFTRFAPAQVIFTPREGGRHLVVVREAAHHRWWGSLAIEVAGRKL
jgi:hypothetical protein